MQKRFDEYFAKVVLEHCFPDRFNELIVTDKPDLCCGQAVGIEVTNCMPKRVAEAFNLWHRVAKEGEQTQPRIIERLEQLEEVQLVDGGLIWTQGLYSQDGLDDFYNAVDGKVERLNSHKADYANMNSYELFVNSFIMIPNWLMRVVIQRLQSMNSKPKKFDTIYLLTNEQKLLVFDMKNGTVYIKYLYSYLDRMAVEAKEIYFGVKNDET